MCNIDAQLANPEQPGTKSGIFQNRRKIAVSEL